MAETGEIEERGRRLAYVFGGGLYLNITNRCPTACRFCAKRKWRWRFRGWNLRLSREPEVAELWSVVEEFAREAPFKELVFCGYGESTYRLPELIEIALKARASFPGAGLRLNTIGLGNLIWGRDIAPELGACLDEVCVSLNTADPAQWLALHAPQRRYREKGFESVLEFIRGCVRCGLETSVTAVEQAGVDLAAAARLAKSLGAGFRARPAL